MGGTALRGFRVTTCCFRVMGEKRHRFRYTWPEAKEICELDPCDIAMAQRLSIGPNALVRAIPEPMQRWKPPVDMWIREMYAKKFGEVLSEEPPPPVEFRPQVVHILPRNSDWPWPDDPQIPEFTPCDPGVDWDDENEDLEIAGILRHQRLYRWAAQSIAISLYAVPEVQSVAAFGSAALPLPNDISHHCADLDLAVWMSRFDDLKALQIAIWNGLGKIEEAHGVHLAHYEVDVHLIDFSTGLYRGRLCSFTVCPKRNRWECRVPDCGEELFLRQLGKYRFDYARFDAEPKVILMERARGFLVNMPMMEDPPPMVWLEYTDDDVPF